MTVVQRLLSRHVAYLFILPVVLIIALLILYPMVRSVVMSFTDWYLLRPNPARPFVGLDNYRDALTLDHFGQMAWVTAIYTVASVSGKMLVGLGTALMLNRDFVGRSFVRGIFIIPWAVPTVVAAIIFRVSLDPTHGIVNGTLRDLGWIQTSINFLSDPNLALGSVIVLAIWKYFPFVTLMILAALQSIPRDLYEAAAIDGATTWSRFRHVTWPLIMPVWSIVLVLQIVWTIKEFELVYLVTRGGPSYATTIIGVDVYLNAFRFFRVGTAAAEGMILLAISVVFAIFYYRFLERR